MMRHGRLWVEGLRPRTLPASVAPVVVGAAAAWRLLTDMGSRVIAPPATGRSADSADAVLAWSAWPGATFRFFGAMVLCLAVALFLQIAVNFANDYSDGIRGTDGDRGGDESRSGKPQRLTASGLVEPQSVLLAAGVAAAVACVCGLAVAAVSHQYWIVLVGVCCLLAGWFYTGGSHPYGYAGWGEWFVFLFFGLVATLGTQFVIVHTVMIGHPSGFPDPGHALGVDWAGLLAAACSGWYAVLVLMVNNLRDVAEDEMSGKRTLAVRLGASRARALLQFGTVGGAVATLALAVTLWTPWGALIWLPLVPASVSTMRAVHAGDFPRSLGAAGRQLLLFAVVMVISASCAAISAF
jgi:1,4-dihydroxy-2-naphthoate octaprenyltransferase